MSIPEQEKISKLDRDLNRIVSRREYLKGLEGYLRSEDGLEFTPQIDKILRCGRVIDGYVSDEGFRVTGGEFCGQSRICRFCGQRRSTRIYAGYLPVVKDLARRYRVWRLNLTIENTHGLETGLYPLLRGWDTFLNRLRYERQRGNPWGIVGGIGSVEVKRGSGSGLWHPHIHNLVFTERNMCRFNVAQLRLMWSTCMREPSNVWVKECRDERGVEKGASDTLKYDVKMANLCPDESFKVWKACQGIRLLKSFGICWGLKGLNEEKRDKGRDFKGHAVRLVWDGKSYGAREREAGTARGD